MADGGAGEGGGQQAFTVPELLTAVEQVSAGKGSTPLVQQLRTEYNAGTKSFSDVIASLRDNLGQEAIQHARQRLASARSSAAPSSANLSSPANPPQPDSHAAQTAALATQTRLLFSTLKQRLSREQVPQSSLQQLDELQHAASARRLDTNTIVNECSKLFGSTATQQAVNHARMVYEQARDEYTKQMMQRHPSSLAAQYGQEELKMKCINNFENLNSEQKLQIIKQISQSKRQQAQQRAAMQHHVQLPVGQQPAQPEQPASTGHRGPAAASGARSQRTNQHKQQYMRQQQMPSQPPPPRTSQQQQQQSSKELQQQEQQVQAKARGDVQRTGAPTDSDADQADLGMSTFERENDEGREKLIPRNVSLHRATREEVSEPWAEEMERAVQKHVETCFGGLKAHGLSSATHEAYEAMEEALQLRMRHVLEQALNARRRRLGRPYANFPGAQQVSDPRRKIRAINATRRQEHEAREQKKLHAEYPSRKTQEGHASGRNDDISAAGGAAQQLVQSETASILAQQLGGSASGGLQDKWRKLEAQREQQKQQSGSRRKAEEYSDGTRELDNPESKKASAERSSKTLQLQDVRAALRKDSSPASTNGRTLWRMDARLASREMRG